MWDWEADSSTWCHRGSLLLSAPGGHYWHFVCSTGVTAGCVWSWRVKINQVFLCGADFNNGEPENSSALQGNVTSGEDYSIVVKRVGHKSCFPSLLI